MAMARGVRLFLSQVVFGVRWHIALAFREAIIASRRWLESFSLSFWRRKGLLIEGTELVPGLIGRARAVFSPSLYRVPCHRGTCTYITYK